MAVSERLNFAVVADVSGAARGMRNLSEVLKATIPINEKLANSGKKIEDMILQLEERLKTGKISQEHYANALAMLQDRQRAIQGQIDGTTKAIRGQGDAVSATAKQWAQFGKSDLDKFNDRMRSLMGVRMQMSRQDFRQAFTALRMQDPRELAKIAEAERLAKEQAIEAAKAQQELADRTAKETREVERQKQAVQALAGQWREFGKSDVDKFKDRARSLLSVRKEMSREDFRKAFTQLRMEDPRIITARLAKEAKLIVPPKIQAVTQQPMISDDVRQALGQMPLVGRFMGTIGPATAGLAAAGVTIGVVAAQFKLLSDAASYSARNIKAAFDEIDQISDTAELLGMTAQSLSLLQTQAALAEVDAGTLQGALQKLEVSLGDAMSGAAGSADKFERLGLDFRSLAQQSPDKQFAAVAAAISSLPTQAEKLNAVFDIFGRGNTKIAKMLAKFQSLQEEAMKTGNVFTEKQRDIMDKADEQMIKLGLTASGIWKQISFEVMPAVGNLAEEFTKLLQDPQVRDELVAMFSRVATIIQVIADNLGSASEKAGSLYSGFKKIADHPMIASFFAPQFVPLIGAAALLKPDDLDVNQARQNRIANEQKLKQATMQRMSVEQLAFDEQAAMFAQWDEWLNGTNERLKAGTIEPEFIARLREEVDTLGMSREQIEQMKIDRMELSDLQRAAIAGLLEEKRIKQEELDLEKEISDMRSKAFDEGARLRESLMSDEERLMKQAENFQQLVNLGALTRDEMGKLLFREAASIADQTPMPRTIQAGTQEAIKAIYGPRRENKVESILERIRENTDPKNQQVLEFFGEGIA